MRSKYYKNFHMRKSTGTVPVIGVAKPGIVGPVHKPYGPVVAHAKHLQFLFGERVGLVRRLFVTPVELVLRYAAALLSSPLLRLTSDLARPLDPPAGVFLLLVSGVERGGEELKRGFEKRRRGEEV